MASKITSINSTLTPSGEIAFANEALGAVPAPVQDRFSAGSLVTNILSVSNSPLLLMIGAAMVIAVDQSVAGNVDSADIANAGLLPAEDSMTVAFDESFDTIGKSGVMYILGEDLTVVSSVTGDGGVTVNDPFRLAVLMPKRPIYSLSTLITKIEAVCKETGKGFVFTLDQDGGFLRLFVYSNPSAANAALNSARADLVTDGVTIKAAFDMIVPSTSASAVKFAFE